MEREGIPRRRAWARASRQHGRLAVARRKAVPPSQAGCRRGWPERGVWVGGGTLGGGPMGAGFLFPVLYGEPSAGSEGSSRANPGFEKNESEIAVGERGAGECT